jgi:sugar O-acyltransferase (sialic acid O-acetyltransferase NeuD family)
MKDLLILGTGVHALEMVEIVERINNAHKTWNLLGFVSPDDESVGKKLNDYPVLCSKEKLSEHKKTFFVPDNNEWYHSLKIPGERFISLIDPGSFVSRTAKIGKGCVIYPNCYIGLNAHIGDYVFCLSGCIINHDVVIEDRVILASKVTLAGSVHVETGCYLGQASACREKLRISRGSLIGMGSVIIKDVGTNSVMAGNPAVKLREWK